MKIFIKKKLIIALVLTILFLSLITAYAVWSNSDEQKRGPKPTGSAESSFLLNEIYYDCSKEIKGEWVEASIGPLASPGYYFRPDNQEEFRKYCREGAVIEYHAVLEILQREDVAQVIDKYDTTRAWVKALGSSYIKDKEYIGRILPSFSNIDIHCIIVVHSPEATRFFIEDGSEEHKYIEVSSNDFLSSLNNAPDKDVSDFWLGLH